MAFEIGGVHDDMDTFWRGKLSFGLSFFEMAVNGFTAAFECSGKLGSSLFACGIGVPQFLRIKSFATFKLSASGMAFIALIAVSATVLFDLF